jgi:hypothetical protein
VASARENVDLCSVLNGFCSHALMHFFVTWIRVQHRKSAEMLHLKARLSIFAETGLRETYIFPISVLSR